MSITHPPSTTVLDLLGHYGVPTDTFSVPLDTLQSDITTEYLKDLLSSLNDIFLRNPSARLAVISVIFSILLDGKRTWVLEIEQSPFRDSLFRSMLLDHSPSLFLIQSRLLAAMLCQAPGRMSPGIPQIMAILARALSWRRRSSRYRSEKDDRLNLPNTFRSRQEGEASASMYSASSSFLHSQLDVVLEPLPDLDWTMYTSQEAWHAPSSILASPMLHNPAVQGLSTLNEEPAIQAGPTTDSTLLLIKPLYAFWPANVANFVRQPEDYFQKHAVLCPFVGGWQTMWGTFDLRALLTPILKDFLFNPSLLTRDAATELAVQSKFTKMDPSETVATAESFFVSRTGHPLREQMGLLSSNPNILPEDDGAKSMKSNDGSEDDVYTSRRTDSSLLADRGMASQPIQIGGHAVGTAGEVDALMKQIESLRLELRHMRRNNELYLQHIHRLHKAAIATTNDEAERQAMFNWLKEQRATAAEQARTIQDFQAEKDRLNRATNTFTERQRTRYAALREEKKSNEAQRRELQAKISELEELLAVKSRANSIIEKTKLELNAENKTLRQDIKHIDQFKEQIAHYEQNQRLWDQDVRNYQEMKKALANMHSGWVQMEYMIVSCNRDRERLSEVIRKQEDEISQLKEQALAKPAMVSAATDKLEQTKQLSADRQLLSEKIESLRLENDSLRRAKLELEAHVEELTFASRTHVQRTMSLLG